MQVNKLHPSWWTFPFDYRCVRPIETGAFDLTVWVWWCSCCVWLLLETVWWFCGPQARPTCSQRCNGHTDTWAADTVTLILPGNAAQAPQISCVCTLLPKLPSAELFIFPIFVSPSFDTQCLFTASAMAAGVSILSDLPYSTRGACGEEISTEMETGRKALHKNNTTSCLIFYFQTMAQDCTLGMVKRWTIHEQEAVWQRSNLQFKTNLSGETTRVLQDLCSRTFGVRWI